MSIFYPLKKWAYDRIRSYRWRIIRKEISGPKVLDIGADDLYFKNKIEEMGLEYHGLDTEPQHESVMKGNIEDLKLKDKSFDTVLCLEVLEHTKDPVKAMKELRRVTKKKLIISVPNEPWFSFWRFMTWEKQHYWAITDRILENYLGKPVLSRKAFFGRYTIMAWEY